MNAFLNIFFIFIFIFAILFFKIPNLDNNNYIIHKIIIFSLLFIFQFALLILSNIKNKCKINVLNIFQSSIETAVIGIIGYSIYNDLQLMGFGIDEIDTIYIGDPKIQYLYVTIIITLLLVFVNTVKLLFGFKPYECIKYD